jgi:S-DNA-T family DNA segregation ATPase FtsK/SpoIIIE
VGSLIVGDDGERVQRLLRMLESTLDERSLRYARAEASTISDYRRLTGALDEARILVLIDGVGAFRSEYDGGASSRWWDLLLTIAAEGRALGVHLVMSAERPAAVPSALAASIQRTLVLRLANDLEYAVVDVPADAFGPNTPPGRGFLDGREVQVAVVGGESDLSRQRVAIERCTDAIADRELLRPPPVESLPKRVALGDLTVETDRPILGVRDDTLTAIDFEPSGVFLVAGGPRSGTSTTVATMVRSLATVRPQTEFVLLGQRRSPLSSIVSWAAFAEGVTAVERLAAGLTDGLVGAGDGPVAIAIEAVGELLDTDADLPLQGLLRACRDRGVFVIAEGEISSLGGSWPLLQAIKSHRTGIVLQPDQIDGEALFRTPFPRLTRAEFPAGRGLMVQGGQVCKVQVALPE